MGHSKEKCQGKSGEQTANSVDTYPTPGALGGTPFAPEDLDSPTCPTCLLRYCDFSGAKSAQCLQLFSVDIINFPASPAFSDLRCDLDFESTASHFVLSGSLQRT